MSFNYEKIPQEMKNAQRWVLWKLREMPNRKTTKVPICAKNGYGAKSNDESTWVSFNEALNKCEYYHCNGLGFMLGDGFFGVDIDHAMNTDKSLIDKFVNELDSYTEISQSGEGIHILCKGVLPLGNRRKGNIEMYDKARFFALTGNIYNNHYSLNERTSEIKALHAEYLGGVNNTPYVFERNEPKGLLNDNEVIAKAQESKSGNLFNCLYYGQWEGLYPSQSEADMAFCMLLAFFCAKDTMQMDRIFRSSKLYREKWDIQHGERTYGQMTIENACARCHDVYTPSFISKTDVYNIRTGEVEKKKQYDLNDTGNAQRFIDRFGENLRYNFDRKMWVVFDGKTWVLDTKQIVKSQADILIEEMKIEAIKEDNQELQKEMLKNIKHLSSNNGKEAMLKEAVHLGATPTTNADYDKNLNILNCLNGVVDLRTGELKGHDKTEMCSKNTNVKCDFSQEPTRWVQFLNEIFNNDKSMVEYIQLAVGYTLTGSTKEQCFFQCYGDGSNGKSVFLDIFYNMLGAYALNSQAESILSKNSSYASSASPEIARMNGARFVRTNEPNDNSRFNEGLLKQLVGGDITTARFLYGTDFDFHPCFKLWIATNYKVNVRGTDAGIWRRVRLIPFNVKFDREKQDKDLTEKLMQELPYILGWAVQGAVKWYKKGLTSPQQVEDAGKQYRAEMDIVASFLTNCVLLKPYSREKASDVYREYSNWAREGHEYCMTQSKFGIEMAKRFQKKNVGGYIYYIGLQLKKNDSSYIYESENK